VFLISWSTCLNSNINLSTCTCIYIIIYIIYHVGALEIHFTFHVTLHYLGTLHIALCCFSDLCFATFYQPFKRYQILFILKLEAFEGFESDFVALVQGDLYLK